MFLKVKKKNAQYVLLSMKMEKKLEDFLVNIFFILNVLILGLFKILNVQFVKKTYQKINLIIIGYYNLQQKIFNVIINKNNKYILIKRVII